MSKLLPGAPAPGTDTKKTQQPSTGTKQPRWAPKPAQLEDPEERFDFFDAGAVKQPKLPQGRNPAGDRFEEHDQPLRQQPHPRRPEDEVFDEFKEGTPDWEPEALDDWVPEERNSRRHMDDAKRHHAAEAPDRHSAQEWDNEDMTRQLQDEIVQQEDDPLPSQKAQDMPAPPPRKPRWLKPRQVNSAKAKPEQAILQVLGEVIPQEQLVKKSEQQEDASDAADALQKKPMAKSEASDTAAEIDAEAGAEATVEAEDPLTDTQETAEAEDEADAETYSAESAEAETEAGTEAEADIEIEINAETNPEPDTKPEAQAALDSDVRHDSQPTSDIAADVEDANPSCSSAQQILQCGQMPVATAADISAHQQCCRMYAPRRIPTALLPPPPAKVDCQRWDLEVNGSLSEPLKWYFEKGEGTCTVKAIAKIPTFGANQVNGRLRGTQSSAMLQCPAMPLAKQPADFNSQRQGFCDRGPQRLTFCARAQLPYNL